MGACITRGRGTFALGLYTQCCLQEAARGNVATRYFVLVAWTNSSIIGHINEVTLCRARLVLGWVTVFVCENNISSV